VSKFSFGARIPFTDLRLPALRDPERGEIVVFALGRRSAGQICPLDECPDYPSEGFVKRIVAIPGDRVEFRDGSLFLNGEKAEVSDREGSFTDDRGRAFQVREESFDGCSHEILDNPELPGLTQQPFTVPEDRYFMLGDNRDNSNDSRIWGTVHRNDIRGPVLINYWSWNNRESWLAMLNPLTWLDLLWNEMYWGRIGMDYDCGSSSDASAPAAEAG
jgi:signal peptidase I